MRSIINAGLIFGIMVLMSAFTCFGEKPLCVQCHAEIGKGIFVHNPVAAGSCEICHTPTGKDHPQETGGFVAVGSAVELCLKCHVDHASNEYVHGPVQGGGCTRCHDPHGSRFRFLLKENQPNLCFRCHNASAFDGLVTHEPVELGLCNSCHNPHSSQWPHLLVRSMPEGSYAPYVSSRYDLCFNCHGSELARYERTATATGFRNGDRNLHFVHVNDREEGRSCKLCHRPHASFQDKLIAQGVEGIGEWMVPMVYEKSSTGGGCLVGCHKPQRYDREQPVNLQP